MASMPVHVAASESTGGSAVALDPTCSPEPAPPHIPSSPSVCQSCLAAPTCASQCHLHIAPCPGHACAVTPYARLAIATCGLLPGDSDSSAESTSARSLWLQRSCISVTLAFAIVCPDRAHAARWHDSLAPGRQAVTTRRVHTKGERPAATLRP